MINFRVSDVVADPSSLSLLECQGVALGCFTLARCLQLGQAVRQNEEKAMQYYSKASVHAGNYRVNDVFCLPSRPETITRPQ